MYMTVYIYIYIYVDLPAQKVDLWGFQVVVKLWETDKDAIISHLPHVGRILPNYASCWGCY